MLDKNQRYHLEPPYGLLNDPNAFLKYNDLYYLFFQWNPLSKTHSHKDWGYFTSKDLINWDFQGKAIKSNSFYDLTVPSSHEENLISGRFSSLK